MPAVICTRNTPTYEYSTRIDQIGLMERKSGDQVRSSYLPE